MEQKSRKTLYFSQWIIDILNAEEEIVSKKPNIIASAAIYDFCNKKMAQKKAILKSYFSIDVDMTVSQRQSDEIVSGAEDDIKVQRQKDHRHRSKYG
jgi:hypothetical protein